MNFFDETTLSISEPPDVLVKIENNIVPRNDDDDDEEEDDCEDDNDDDDTEDDSGIAEETDLTPIIKQFPEIENFDSNGDDGANVNHFLNYW